MAQDRTTARGSVAEFGVTLDHECGIPIYKQIVQGIKRSIIDGRIRAGQRVPSTRELAHVLGVNRLTVLKSFGELVHEGLVETVVGAGTFVIQPESKPEPMCFAPPPDSIANDSMIEKSAVAELLTSG